MNLGGSSKKDHISSDISNLVGEQRGFLRDFMKKFRKHLKNNVKKLVSEGLPRYTGTLETPAKTKNALLTY